MTNIEMYYVISGKLKHHSQVNLKGIAKDIGQTILIW